jgi:hypothetical protein
MMRLRRLGRPSKLDIAIFVLAVAVFITGLSVLHGSKPVSQRFRFGKGYTTVVNQPTHAVDIIRTLLMIGGVALALFAFYRWGTRGERGEDLNADEERRHFGDSITDARTNQDPRIGMTPVRTDAPRR